MITELGLRESSRMSTSLLPHSPEQFLHSPDLAALLRDRVAAALANMAPGTQRAYADGLERFAVWFENWMPNAPVHLAAALPPGQCGDDNHDWWSVIVRLLRSQSIVATTVVEHFKVSTAAGNASATRALRLNAVRWPFRLAYDASIVPWQLRVRAPKVEAYRDTRGPGINAVHRLFATAAKLPGDAGARDTVLLGLLFVLGLRRAEVAELDVKHFEASERKLLVRSKGKLDRVPVGVPIEVAEAITRYLASRGPLVIDAPLVASHDRNVDKGDGRLTGNGIWRRVVWLARKARVEARTTPHGLRHTAITAALDATNGNTRAVRSFSRHAKDETVGRYDDNRRDVGGKIAEQLAVLITPKPPKAE